MKKQLIIIFLLLAGIGVINHAYAQNTPVPAAERTIKNDGKYALLVQNAKHFMVSVMTGEEYRTQSEKIDFEIILIGAVVKDLAENTELKPFITKAEQSGIKIVVCEFAMNQLAIKKSQYPSSVQTTPNGFTYLFGLQESGFKTITL